MKHVKWHLFAQTTFVSIDFVSVLLWRVFGVVVIAPHVKHTRLPLLQSLSRLWLHYSTINCYEYQIGVHSTLFALLTPLHRQHTRTPLLAARFNIIRAALCINIMCVTIMHVLSACFCALYLDGIEVVLLLRITICNIISAPPSACNAPTVV